MVDPLELAYNWRLPVAVSSVGLVASIGILVRSQVVGWLSAAILLVLCYAVFVAVVWGRTQAYLLVDGAFLTVRTFWEVHRIEGASVVKVTQVLTRKGRPTSSPCGGRTAGWPATGSRPRCCAAATRPSSTGY